MRQYRTLKSAFETLYAVNSVEYENDDQSDDDVKQSDVEFAKTVLAATRTLWFPATNSKLRRPRMLSAVNPVRRIKSGEQGLVCPAPGIYRPIFDGNEKYNFVIVRLNLTDGLLTEYKETRSRTIVDDEAKTAKGVIGDIKFAAGSSFGYARIQIEGWNDANQNAEPDRGLKETTTLTHMIQPIQPILADGTLASPTFEKLVPEKTIFGPAVDATDPNDQAPAAYRIKLDLEFSGVDEVLDTKYRVVVRRSGNVFYDKTKTLRLIQEELQNEFEGIVENIHESDILIEVFKNGAKGESGEPEEEDASEEPSLEPVAGGREGEESNSPGPTSDEEDAPGDEQEDEPNDAQEAAPSDTQEDDPSNPSDGDANAGENSTEQDEDNTPYEIPVAYAVRTFVPDRIGQINLRSRIADGVAKLLWPSRADNSHQGEELPDELTKAKQQLEIIRNVFEENKKLSEHLGLAESIEAEYRDLLKLSEGDAGTIKGNFAVVKTNLSGRVASARGKRVCGELTVILENPRCC